MKTWRRHLHQHPELVFDCHETATFIVEKLRAFGVDEIHEGIAESGVVAVINGQGDGPVTGLRADMDALPIEEASGVDHASRVPGKMHACGHDGHTTMLLGAAKYLAETRAFKGKAVLIFQPAEENGGGAGVMVQEGVLDRFKIEEVYALHNIPEIPLGHFHTNPGALMAAVDTFEIYITGKGGHGALPKDTCDPIVAAVGMVQAIQTIVSRNVSAQDELTISVTQIHTGSADNIIPSEAYICGTVRTFDTSVQDIVARRLAGIVAGQAASFGVEATLDLKTGYPATVNDPEATAFALDVVRDIVGPDAVNGEAPRNMGAEDFSYMLQERPGAYLNLGQGGGPSLHHPAYDFNDEISPFGASFFARMVEQRGPL
ncbi:UNVERIFIED_CONTAM: hypothetical protein GTU68_022020 [Idotea baltica]|nr:hypothetical protein [Idotea baltica]